MKICNLCAVIMVLLTNDACAYEQTDQNNLIITYDPGEVTSETPSFPRHGKITADNHHPKNHDHIRFEDQSPDRPLKFKDDSKEHVYPDIDKVDAGSLLADVSFDNEVSSDQDGRNFNIEIFRDESNNSGKKIKFEGNNNKADNFDDQESNDEEDNPQNGRSQVVFEDDGEAYKDSDYSDKSKTKLETTNKQIKFEDRDNKSDYNTNNRYSVRNSVTERVVFKDDGNRNQQTVQKKTRKGRKKPRFEAEQSNPAAIPSNSPYPGLGYPGYPGVGYPGSEDPSAGYPGYQTTGHQAPGYPYPNYPSHPGYSPYPKYPPNSPGFGAYPPPGYQVPGDQRPAGIPATYPSPGQSEPSGYTDTRYPSQEYAGSLTPGAAQIAQPGSSYPGPKYPYYQGYPVPGYPPVYPGDPNSQYPYQSQEQYSPPGAHQQGYQIGLQRPSRRPKSLTQRAVSAVAEALTSIALYDDQQCVPRILCEVAGGSTPSSPTLLKASASLQPLLSLLQAYNGVSSSPLFIFGHAAVTGMTAKTNPSACYRAYPKCPRDPEKLINYLNNHNGGFFRFFGQPEAPQKQQNLEQFYNFLSGQNSSLQQPQQNYVFPRPNGYGFHSQNPYSNSYNYGYNNYNERIGYGNAKTIPSEAEGRIQNKPGINALEDESDLETNESQDNGSKWSFPEEGSTKKGNKRDKNKIKKQPERPSRGTKTLKFPDDRSDDRRESHKVRDYPRKEKHIFFPKENYFQINTKYQTTTPVNPEEYYFDHKHNFYVKRPKALKNDDVVYVVRGNGDPNHPEIVRVRPGQSI